MVRSYESGVRFLQELHAKDIAFFERDLLGHLEGTHRILYEWSASDDLAWAGLFHAIYLTDFFKCNEPTVANRHRVRQVIGSNAEQIAYHYCVMNRVEFIKQTRAKEFGFEDTYTGSHIVLSETEDHGLATLIWANAVEQLLLDVEARPLAKPLFEASQHRVGPKALAAYANLYREDV